MNATEQQRRSLYLLELKQLASCLPPLYRDQFTQEFMTQVAEVLLDGTIFEIIRELREEQKITENNLYKNRCDKLREHELMRKEILSRNQPLFTSTSLLQQVDAHSYGTQHQNAEDNKELSIFEENCKEELKRVNMQIILELDQLVAQQQSILEKAGLPGFKLSNKREILKFQIHLTDFIENIYNKISKMSQTKGP